MNAANQKLFLKLTPCTLKNVVPLVEIFLTTFYGLYFSLYIVGCRSGVQLLGPDTWYNRGGPAKMGAHKSSMNQNSNKYLSIENTCLDLSLSSNPSYLSSKHQLYALASTQPGIRPCKTCLKKRTSKRTSSRYPNSPKFGF